MDLSQAKVALPETTGDGDENVSCTAIRSYTCFIHGWRSRWSSCMVCPGEFVPSGRGGLPETTGNGDENLQSGGFVVTAPCSRDEATACSGEYHTLAGAGVEVNTCEKKQMT